MRAQGLATDRPAVEAAWSPPVFRSGRARVGTEEHGEWPQELTGRQSGVTWSLNGGRGRITPGREARRGAGREVGVPGTTDVE